MSEHHYSIFKQSGSETLNWWYTKYQGNPNFRYIFKPSLTTPVSLSCPEHLPGVWLCQPCRINIHCHTTMSCVSTPDPLWGFISSWTSLLLETTNVLWASFSAYLLNLLIDWTSWSCLLMGSSASSQGLGCTGGLKEQAAKITTESHLGIKNTVLILNFTVKL